MIQSFILKFNLSFAIVIVLIFFYPIHTFTQHIVWKKNFGASSNSFYSITAVPDGMIAVGSGVCCNLGDWEGVESKGKDDAIVVKFDNSGSVIWKKNFGGEDGDYFRDVTTVSDGIVAVGYSRFESFNTGDWKGIVNKGYQDAIIVKYNRNGSVVWKRNFGGIHNDFFTAVSALSDGVVAVGHSSNASFNTGDWEGIGGKGGQDAIIVKFDHAGNVVWKKNFGGKDSDYFNFATTVADNIFVVGGSSENSFNNGDWEYVEGKGSSDAFIIKYDINGSVVWKKNFGGNGSDSFQSVIVVSDGIVAAGYSFNKSFGNGDWKNTAAKGSIDAIIVKFDFAGNIVWKNNFGGTGADYYCSVTEVSDGFIAVGWGSYSTVNYGDTEGIIVKYDIEGNEVWNNRFGGSSYDGFESVIAVSNGVVVVGDSHFDSFGNGDWEGVVAKGFIDAIIVKYSGAGIGIDEPLQELSDIKVYPNPTTGKFTVEWTSGRVNEWASVEVFDVFGRMQNAERRMQKKNSPLLEGWQPQAGGVVIDISHLVAGVYLIKITTDKGGVVKKVIKQ